MTTRTTILEGCRMPQHTVNAVEGKHQHQARAGIRAGGRHRWFKGRSPMLPSDTLRVWGYPTNISPARPTPSV